jgi:archaellum component FlaC
MAEFVHICGGIAFGALLGWFCAWFSVPVRERTIKVAGDVNDWLSEKVRKLWMNEYEAISLRGKLKKAHHDRDRYRRRIAVLDAEIKRLKTWNANEAKLAQQMRELVAGLQNEIKELRNG